MGRRCRDLGYNNGARRVVETLSKMKRDASASEQEEETAKETEGGTGLLRLAILYDCRMC